MNPILEELERYLLDRQREYQDMADLIGKNDKQAGLKYLAYSLKINSWRSEIVKLLD